MARRVTIMIEDELDKKIRKIQARRIPAEEKSISYSKVINDTLRKAL